MSFFIVSAKTNAQDDKKRECTIKYNLFKPDFQSKNYTAAYENWIYLMDNCQDLSVNIYKYGATIAEDVRKDPVLAKRVYEQRLQYFPKNNPAKVHSDYATYLAKNKLASNDEIFSLLEKAYQISPKDMSVKNIYRYFQGVTDKYKDVKPQRVFDTYDDVTEKIEEENNKLTDVISQLLPKEEAGTLTSKDKRKLKVATTNSESYGKIAGSVDSKLGALADCENLIPLYQKSFESKKTDVTWVKRAVGRMFSKDCTDDPMFQKLFEAQLALDPSADAYVYGGTLKKKAGDTKGAIADFNKALDLETDSKKKSNIAYKIATSYRRTRSNRSKSIRSSFWNQTTNRIQQ